LHCNGYSDECMGELKRKTHLAAIPPPELSIARNDHVRFEAVRTARGGC